MNPGEFRLRSRRLAESQEKLVSTVFMMLEVIDSLNNRLALFQEYLEATESFYAASRRMKEAEDETSEQLLASLAAIMKAFAETNVTINENSERMEKLLTKVEAYFGTTGLDYDN